MTDTPSMKKSDTHRRAGRWLRWAGLMLVAWSLMAWGAAQALVWRRELPHQVDALVVLGGSAAYLERTRWAAQLFHQGRASRIILTNDNGRGGWSPAQQRNPFFYERATDELMLAGISRERIEVLPEPISSTYEEALVVRDYAVTHHLKSLLIVTSGYHSRRAGWTFARVFRETNIEVGLDAPPLGSVQSPPPASWWLREHGWQSVALEYPKLIYYWIHYR